MDIPHFAYFRSYFYREICHCESDFLFLVKYHEWQRIFIIIYKILVILEYLNL